MKSGEPIVVKHWRNYLVKF